MAEENYHFRSRTEKEKLNLNKIPDLKNEDILHFILDCKNQYLEKISIMIFRKKFYRQDVS